MDKELILKKEILTFLLNNPETSIKKIADVIKKTEKTTRTKLEQLNDLLIEKNFGTIEKKPGKGVSLKLNSDKKNQLTKYFNGLKFNELVSKDNGLNLIFMLLQLSGNEYIKQTDLADQLYVSLPTFRKILRSVEGWFIEHRIEIKSVSGKGLRLIGDEFSKRIAIRDAILVESNDHIQLQRLKNYAKGISISEISEVIRKAENEWKIKFSNESFTKILIMLVLSISRFANTMEKAPTSDDFENVYSNEYSFVETLYRGLEERGFGTFNEVERKILTAEILISNKLRWKDSAELKDVKNQYDQDLAEFVKKIISTISEILQKSLSDDIVLREELTNHLRSAIFRMKYGRKNSVDLSRELKEIYSRVFLSVWSTSQLFEDYYNVQLTENEITYIVLYIEAAILRTQKKVTAVLITDQGRSQSLFAVEFIKRNLPQIRDIAIIRKEELQEPNEELLYLTMVKVEQIAAIHISYIPTPSDIENIRKALTTKKAPGKHGTIFSEVSKPLLDPYLIFMNQDYSDKEKILKFLSQCMEERGFVSPAFYDTVWQREVKTTTCIGCHTAIPHGSMREVFEPKVAIMHLKKPILWYEDEFVDTIFLLATRMSTQVEIRQNKHFYRELINFTEDSSLLENFKSIQTNIDAFNYLFMNIQ